MRKSVTWSVVFALVISLAAPSGAAFGLEEVMATGEERVELSEVAVDESRGSDIKTVEEAEKGEVELEEPRQVDNGAPISSIQQVPDESAHEPEPTPGSDLPSVVIAQIQVGLANASSDEYVSLYNNGDTPVDITGWCLSNKGYVKFACFSEHDTEHILDPGAYIGLSTAADRPDNRSLMVLFAPRAASGGHIVAGDNVITLVDNSGRAVDTLQWNKNGGYVIERLRNLHEPHRLRTGDGSWAWANQLTHYGYIEDLSECADGSLVYSTDQCPSAIVVNECSGIVIAEVAANTSEQFIELYNTNAEPVGLEGCQVMTNRSSTKAHVFDEGVIIEEHSYMTVVVSETDLLLTKTTSGVVYVLSSDGAIEVDSVEYSNLAKETSWSKFDDKWQQTYVITPGAGNVYEKYPPCEEGYWRNEETGRCNKIVEPTVLADCGEGRERNPETGRCRNIPAASVLTPCREGQYRSEETNRCRSIASVAASVLKPCADDQFRNPLTNRCKKIASAEELALADCGEGRERNPATNRCRNVLSAAMPSVPFAPDEITEAAQGMLGWWALGGVSLVALGYAGWQWRFEAGRLVRRIGRVFASGSKE